MSMDDIGKKLKGHRLTEMNYFEHQNIHNLDLINSVLNSKELVNTTEGSYYYDTLLQNLYVNVYNNRDPSEFNLIIQTNFLIYNKIYL